MKKLADIETARTIRAGSRVQRRRGRAKDRAAIGMVIRVEQRPGYLTERRYGRGQAPAGYAAWHQWTMHPARTVAVVRWPAGWRIGGGYFTSRVSVDALIAVEDEEEGRADAEV